MPNKYVLLQTSPNIHTHTINFKGVSKIFVSCLKSVLCAKQTTQQLSSKASPGLAKRGSMSKLCILIEDINMHYTYGSWPLVAFIDLFVDGEILKTIVFD